MRKTLLSLMTACATVLAVQAQNAKPAIPQDAALEATAEILMRSVVGLSGIQHSADNNKPRGILYRCQRRGLCERVRNSQRNQSDQ